MEEGEIFVMVKVLICVLYRNIQGGAYVARYWAIEEGGTFNAIACVTSKSIRDQFGNVCSTSIRN